MHSFADSLEMEIADTYLDTRFVCIPYMIGKQLFELSGLQCICSLSGWMNWIKVQMHNCSVSCHLAILVLFSFNLLLIFWHLLTCSYPVIIPGHGMILQTGMLSIRFQKMRSGVTTNLVLNTPWKRLTLQLWDACKFASLYFGKLISLWNSMSR